MAPAPAPPTAIAFPGVGVRLCGHEAGWVARHPKAFRPLLRLAAERAGVDLAARLEGGGLEALDDRAQQLFVFAFSAGLFRVLAGRVEAVALAAPSFGLYAALEAGGCLSFADAMAALERAEAVVREAARGLDGGMGVVLGMDEADLTELLAEPRHRGLCRVNQNSDLCHVFAGLRPGLSAFLEECARLGALKAELLPVAAPYHHPELLAGAAERFRGFLQGLAWRPARVPLVSSLDRRFLTGAEELLDFTARNIAEPISWRAVVAELHARGVRRLLECGPGLSLTQNGRFMPFDLAYLNVRSAESGLSP